MDQKSIDAQKAAQAAEAQKNADAAKAAQAPPAPAPATPPPAGGEQTGLKVAGYRPTQPQAAIDLVNENKALEERVLRQIDKIAGVGNAFDQRFVSIARTNVELAFMALNRAVFQPQRIALPGDAPKAV